MEKAGRKSIFGSYITTEQQQFRKALIRAVRGKQFINSVEDEQKKQ